MAGFPAVRENLENQEKMLFLEKVRENLEKSGNFRKNPFEVKVRLGDFFPECLEFNGF